jgi:hypothetical protein
MARGGALLPMRTGRGGTAQVEWACCGYGLETMFDWFATARVKAFGKEMASQVLRDLGTSAGKRETKFATHTEKLLVRADQRVREFTAGERMNFYKKARLANTFLWALKDAGCPPDYAEQLTEWLTFRL